MSRLLFDSRERIERPRIPDNTIQIEAPSQLPRLVPVSMLRKTLPIFVGILVVVLIVCMVFTGMRIISPQMLIYPFMMLMAVSGMFFGTNNKALTTEEVNAERADYKRYLSQIREEIISCADQQRTALNWSHPDPQLLAKMPGTQRLWERDHLDDDFLTIRVGLDDIPLSTRINVAKVPNDLDLEPVSHTALKHLLDAHRTVHNAPVTIQLQDISYISVSGSTVREAISAVAAWVLQAATWHEPGSLTLAVSSADIDSPEWGWAKWLPHTDIPHSYDGSGSARYLFHNNKELLRALGTQLASRSHYSPQAEGTGHHYVVIIEGQEENTLNEISKLLRNGVTVIHITNSPIITTEDRWTASYLCHVHEDLKFVHLGDQKTRTVASADRVSPEDAAFIARKISAWEANPLQEGVKTSANIGADFNALLGINDPAHLDVSQLWSQRTRDRELVVPIGITTNGSPLLFDLKEEAEGGMGPHGLMIGMTGSGKSQTIMAMLLALLTTHSAERLIVIYADFKGEAGADIFREFPQVVAVISNMNEKKSLAERFGHTLRGEVARRERALKEYGRMIQGSAFGSITEYENAINLGHNLPPIPTLLIVADEFTLMLQDYPEYAELFDYIARKGRSLRIHILFASQTLDVGKIKDIDKNTSYRIGLKVASPSISRQIIGSEDAYRIGAGKDNKGVGFFVSAPGAQPVKFRSTYVDKMYEAPVQESQVVVDAQPEVQLFTNSLVPEIEDIVIHHGEEVRKLPPTKLVALIGDQLRKYGPTAPRLWLPPLDTPIPLDAILTKWELGKNGGPNPLAWPIGEIDRPFDMKRSPLVFDATLSAGNMAIHGGPKSGKSTALQSFVISAATQHSPQDVQFYCFDYGGGPLNQLKSLAHVGVVASSLEQDKIRRTIAELQQLLRHRQEYFTYSNISSIDEYRRLRKIYPEVDDGFGDVFLVIDNLYAFSRDNTDMFNNKNPLLPQITDLTARGLAYGIHVIISTTSWLEVPLSMRESIGYRLELKLQDLADTNVRQPGALRKPAEFVPADEPGRGLTMQAEHFRFALPRLDGVENDSNLPEAIDYTISVLNEQYPGMIAPNIRLLPSHVTAEEVNTDVPGESIVIGIREQDLAPVPLSFEENPLTMVLGDTQSGKSSFLRHVIRQIKQKYGEEDVAFTVIDRRLQLVNEQLYPDNEYTSNLDRVTPAMLGLAGLLHSRMPPTDLPREQLAQWKYTGQKHYLIIDDVDLIPDAPHTSGQFIGRRPWDGLIPLLAQANDIGLRVVIAARASGSSVSLMTSPLLKRFNDLQANTIMLSGSAQDSAKIRGQKFEIFPPGRGIFLGTTSVPVHLQLIHAPQMMVTASSSPVQQQ